MTLLLYEKNDVNTNILIDFIKPSRLPSVIFQLSKLLGKNTAIRFYLEAKGKRVYIPKKFSDNICLLRYLDTNSCKKLIQEMPGARLDFRERNTGLEVCFGEAFRLYLKREYLRKLSILKAQFSAEYQISRSYLDTIIRTGIN